MKPKIQLYIITSMVCLLPSNVYAQLKSWSSINGRGSSDHFECKVRGSSTASFNNSFVIQTRCKKGGDDKEAEHMGYFQHIRDFTHSYTSFEFGPSTPEIEVEISTKSGSPLGQIQSVKVRPESLLDNGVKVNIPKAGENGYGKAYLKISKHCNFSVDVNGQMENRHTGYGYDRNNDRMHALTIFANPPMPEPTGSVKRLSPNSSSSLKNQIQNALASNNAVILENGVHEGDSPSGTTEIAIPTGKTVHIAGNAIVHATFRPASNAINWKVNGSGTISGEHLTWNGDEVDANKVFKNGTSGIELKGFVVIDPANHTFNMYNNGDSTNVYHNLKVIGWRQNSDGINPFRNSTVTNCFFRVQDDAFYYGTNVQMENNVVWTDANGAVIYLARGDEGATSANWKRSYLRNTTVIYGRTFWKTLNGGMGVVMRQTDIPIKHAWIDGMTLEDPHPSRGPFLYSHSDASGKGGPFAHENVLIERLVQKNKGNVTEDDLHRIPVTGRTGSQSLSGITFKDCSYAGQKLSSKDDNFPNSTQDIFMIGSGINLNSFINFSSDGGSTPTQPGLPSGWSSSGVAMTPAAGSATYNSSGPTWNIIGSGDGINGTADIFHFVNRNQTGNCTGNVNLSMTQSFGTVGLMIRDGVAASARYAMIAWSSAEGVVLKYRSSTSSTNQKIELLPPGTPISAFTQIELKRVDNTFTARVYKSGTDPITSITISGMPSSANVGYAVSGIQGNTSQNANCTFTGNFVSP